jgi:hypothetical protein
MNSGLSRRQYRAIARARLAFAESLQEQVPSDELLPMLVMAAAIGFVDIVRAAAGEPTIIAFVNGQIERAGLKLVPSASGSEHEA